jgi:hypothetical protein
MNRGSLHTYSEAFGFATPGRLSIDYYHKTTAHERPSRFMFEQAFKYIDDGQSEKVAAAPGIQRQIVMKTATKRRPFFGGPNVSSRTTHLADVSQKNKNGDTFY